MAQTPTGRSGGESAVEYLRAWNTISGLLLSGSSWSGNEHNCCFLNTGKKRFCEIAPASGLDFPQDGRAVALVDWDHDGDLDFWTINRNAPRVRFVRNDYQNGNHYLAIRLAGTKCNRDAIGARLELHLSGSPKRLIKSVRAGEGFLSQSSKWVHFGLGTRDTINKLVVRWPGGDVTEYRDLLCDRRFVIVQGAKPKQWTPPHVTQKLKASQPRIPASSLKTRIVILQREDGPRLHYESFNGPLVNIEQFKGDPLLINVWATWCAPCLAELADFRDNAESLRAAGLNILAISVDGLRDGEKRDPAAVLAVSKKLKFPFDAGMATESAIQMLEMGPGMFLNRYAPLPIPSSFLFDKEGKIAIIYTGPVSSKQLLEDVKLLSASQGELLNVAVPFPGRWLDKRRAKLAVATPVEKLDGGDKSPRLLFVTVVILGIVTLLLGVIAIKRRKRWREDPGESVG